jgi:hypothetical protein
VVGSEAANERTGRMTTRVIYDVPLAAAPMVIERIKKGGAVKAQQARNDLYASDGKLALARIEVTLANREAIVGKDDGLMPKVREGLSRSVTVLLFSLSWLIVGLCVVVPWGVVGYGGYRIVRRLSRSTPPAQ